MELTLMSLRAVHSLVLSVGLLAAISPASFGSAADAAGSAQPERRDGSWLRKHIGEYRRFRDSREPISVEDTADAVLGIGYIRGVLDQLEAAVSRARMQVNFAHAAQETKTKIPPEALREMIASAGLFAPLWKTDCFTDDKTTTTDQYVQIISSYLDAHPEKSSDPAHKIIEDALRAAFPAAAK
jgi:Rap1a immunity proteins